MLFCDVTGSTALGERLDPETLRARCSRGTSTTRASAIERHGGTVEKFIGDAVMAVFGVPQVHEDDALRARVRGAPRRAPTERELEPTTGRLALRIGVNTGEVVTGTEDAARRPATRSTSRRGSSRRRRPARSCSARRPAARARRGRGRAARRRSRLKGKREPVTAYRLLALAGEAAAYARRLDAPLVGRDRELALLAHALRERRASERACRLFTVLGPAGVGKSRLVARVPHARSTRRRS